MAKLLAVDLDGTLFYPKRWRHCINSKNIHFLRKWIDEGNKVVLVTSRCHEFTQKLEREIKRPFDTINCSSSQIYCNGELIRDLPMDPKILKEIMDGISEKYDPLGYIISTANYPCLIVNRHVSNFIHFLYNIVYFFQMAYKEPFCLDEKDMLLDKEMKSGKIYKVMAFFGLMKSKSEIAKQINKKLREEHPDIEAAWSSTVVELTCKGADKGTGVEYYCKYNNIDPSDVYVIGDSGNDIPMFTRYPEHSYCMSHAYTSVRKYAKHTINRVSDLTKLVLKGDK